MNAYVAALRRARTRSSGALHCEATTKGHKRKKGGGRTSSNFLGSQAAEGKRVRPMHNTHTSTHTCMGPRAAPPLSTVCTLPAVRSAARPAPAPAPAPPLKADSRWDTPKSATTACSGSVLVMRTLAARRSRCRMPRECRCSRGRWRGCWGLYTCYKSNITKWNLYYKYR